MVKFIGISLIALGIIILYIIGRRKFRRRGVAGLEGFSSYQAGSIYPFPGSAVQTDCLDNAPGWCFSDRHSMVQFLTADAVPSFRF